MPRFKPDELELMALRLLKAAAVPSADAQIVAQHLVGANLSGHDSHGVLRLPQYLKAVQSGKALPGVRPRVIADHGCTASLDGQRGFGQVVGSEAVKLAMSKVKKSGIAAVSFCN